MTIPKGHHCYEPIGWIVGGNLIGDCHLKIEVCEYYSCEPMEDGETIFGYCSFEHCEIEDQCKICGINEEWYGE